VKLDKALFERIPGDGWIAAHRPLLFSGFLLMGQAEFHLYPQLDAHCAIRVLLEEACVHLGATDWAERCSRDGIGQTNR